jgi:bacteriocin-like protein
MGEQRDKVLTEEELSTISGAGISWSWGGGGNRSSRG